MSGLQTARLLGLSKEKLALLAIGASQLFGGGYSLRGHGKRGSIESDIDWSEASYDRTGKHKDKR